MAQQTIGLGASANDGTGDPIRTAFGKVNANFTELYAGVPLNNFTATRVPDANDDSGDGYSVGSLWADVAAIAIAPAPIYYCADPAPGAAVWERITPFSTLYNSYMQLYATTRNPNVNDDELSLLFASQVWVNTATPSVWVSLDSTAGAAVWQQIYPAAGGGPLNNFTATTDPTVNDDSGDGYAGGSLWLHGAAFWILIDPTPGAAFWKRVIVDGDIGDVFLYFYTNQGTAPTPADDWAPVGAVWVDTTASPRTVYVCTDNTAATAVWAQVYPAAGGGSPGGSNKQVQYNNSSAFGGAAGVTIEGLGQAKFALGTLTASAKAVDITGTFNDAGTVFAAPLSVDIITTNYAAGSNIVDFKVNGSSLLSIGADGFTTIAALSIGNLSVGSSMTCGARTSYSGYNFNNYNDGVLMSGGNGVFLLLDSSYAAFDRLVFGGTDSGTQIVADATQPALKPSGTTLKVRLGDDSGDAHLSAATVTHPGMVFANLPASPVAGMTACVTDSNTNTWGATIAGGGANTVLAWYNGTNWTVVGK